MDKYKPFLGYDQAFYKGHTYSSHSPGMSLLMAPSYLLSGKIYENYLTNNFKLSRKDVYQKVAWLVQITSLPVLIAFAFVALYSFLQMTNRSRFNFPITLLMYFGTLIFPLSTIGFTESMAFPIIMIGLILYFKSLCGSRQNRYLFFSGLCFAVTIAMKPSFILIGFAVGVHLLLMRRGLVETLLYAVPCVVILGLFLLRNWIIFDGPFNFNVMYFAPGGVPATKLNADLFGLKFVSLNKLYQMTLGSHRGLFFFTPMLLFAIPGFYALYSTRFKQFAVVNLLTIVMYFGFMFGYRGWAAGADFGFKHSLPFLPSVIILLAYWLSINVRNRRIIIALPPIVWSCCFSIIAAITSPWVDPRLSKNPLLMYSIPLLLDKGSSNVLTHSSSNYKVLKDATSYSFNVATTSSFLVVVLLIVTLVVIQGSRKSRHEDTTHRTLDS